jgi:predicted permease
MVSQLRSLIIANTEAARDIERRTSPVQVSDGRIENTRLAIYRSTDVSVPTDPTAGLISPSLMTAVTAVAVIVLAIAATNVAGLSLGRGVSRRPEVAVRRALGAGDMRVARQFLTETAVLVVPASCLGLVLAQNLLGIFRATVPSTLTFDVPLDWRVVLFVAGLCGITTTLVGVGPALAATRVKLSSAFGGRRAISRPGRTPVQHAVIFPQVGLTVVLLILAGMQVRALVRVESAEQGYEAAGATVIRIARTDFHSSTSMLDMSAAEKRTIAKADASHRGQLLRSIAESVRAVGGVEHVAFATALPFRSTDASPPQSVAAFDVSSKAAVSTSAVSGEYFSALRIALRAGDTFHGTDAEAGHDVAVISQSLADQLWGGAGAVGRAIAFEAPSLGAGRWLEVIGVVDDVSPILSTSTSRPMVYLPLSIAAGRGGHMFRPELPMLIVRGHAKAIPNMTTVRDAVLGVDPSIEIAGIHSTEAIVAEILYPRRLAAVIVLAGGLIGLILAICGQYSLVSQTVAHQERELGVRVALGASPRDLIVCVLRNSVAVIGVGLVVGVAVAFVAMPVAARLIAGLPLFDFVSATAVVIVFCCVAALASYLPARRATRVDPMTILQRD